MRHQHYIELCWMLLTIMCCTSATIPTFPTTSNIVVVDCSNGFNVVLQSSTKYILNCTQAQPGFRTFVDEVGSNRNLSNVVVHTIGGNVLPRWGTTGTSVGATIAHVAFQLSNLHIPQEIAFGFTPVLQMRSRIILNDIHIALDNVTLCISCEHAVGKMFDLATSPGALPTDRVTDRITFAVTNSPNLTLRYTRSNVLDFGTGPSLFGVKFYTTLRNVVVTVVHSAVWYRAFGVGHLVQMDGDDASLDDFNHLDAFRVALEATTIAMSVDATCVAGGSASCRGGGFKTSSLIYMESKRLDNISLSVGDVQWVATNPISPEGYRVSSQLYMLHFLAPKLDTAAVQLHRVNASASAGTAAALVFIEVKDVERLDLALMDVVAHMSLAGELSVFDSMRSAIFVFLDQLTSHANIAMTNCTAHFHVLSGELTAGAIAQSSLGLVGADLVVVNGGTVNTTFRMDRCVVNAAVRGGTVPLYAGQPLTIITIAAALLHLLKVGAHQTLTVSIDSSAVYTSMGFSLPSTVVYVFVSSMAAVLIATANATNAVVDITNSRVYVGSTSFGPILHSGSSALGNVNAFNITAVFQAVDIYSLLLLMLPQYLLTAISTLTGGVFATISGNATQHNVTVRIQNASVSYGMGDGDEVRDVDLLCVVALSAVMTDSRFQVASIESSSSGSSDDRRRGQLSSVVSSFGATHVSGTRIAVQAVGLRATALPFAATVAAQLLTASCGSLVLDNVSLSFQGCAVGRPTSLPTTDRQSIAAPVTAYSSYSGQVFQIDATAGRTRLAVDGCRFANLSVLVDPTRVSLGALSLGCNLWNQVALPLDVLGVPIDGRLEYPRGVYEDGDGHTTVCKGIQTQTHTPSTPMTPSEALVVVEAPPPMFSIVSNVANVGAFASVLGPVVPRSAVGAVQGVVGLLRLAAECHKGRAGSSDEAEDEGAAVMDNPMQLSLNIDKSNIELRYVSGAVVGNTLFVAVVGAVLHGCALAHHRMQQRVVHPNLAQRLALDVLPRTQWPGCLLVPLGVLLEPVVKMNVVLMGVGHKSVGALGGVVLALWIGVVAFIAYRVLRVRPLPMRAVDTRALLRRSRVNNATQTPGVSVSTGGQVLHMLRTAVQWATEPSEVFGPPRERQLQGYAEVLEVHYSCAYEPYKSPYTAFLLVEYGSTVLAGVLLGAAVTVDPASACNALQWCGSLLAVLYGGVAAAVLYLRPFAVRSDTIASATVQTLCAASAIAVVSSAADSAAEQLALAASCVELLTVALGVSAHLMASNLRRLVNRWNFSAALAAPWAAGDIMAANLGRHALALLKKRTSSTSRSEGRRDNEAAILGLLDATDGRQPHRGMQTPPPASLESLIAIICDGQQRRSSSRGAAQPQRPRKSPAARRE